METPEEVNATKNALFGQYLEGERWASRLYRKLTHKALDIPDEDMNLNVDNSRTGFSGRQMIAAAMVAGGLPIAGMALPGLLDAAKNWATKEEPAPIVQPIKERVVESVENLEFGLGQEEEYLDE